MVVAESGETRLSAFGCEMLARIASYHTSTFDTNEAKDKQKDDAELGRFISRLCATSSAFVNHIRRDLIKSPATLTFNENNVEISCRDYSIKFVDHEDLRFFIEMVRPYFIKIRYNGTFLYRVHLIKISNALKGQLEQGYTCFNEKTLLKFDKLGNDNAYGTLIECLGGKVKRIEIDDEFVAQLRDEEYKYDFLKIKSQSRSDMYYTKSYFDVFSHEYDLRNVCTLTNMTMFGVEDFDLKPLDYIHKISMSLGENEDPGSVEEGARYLEYLAPSLEQLVFTQNKGIMFSNPDVSYQAARQIEKFVSERYEELATNFPKIKLEVILELSIYLKGVALADKINWFAELGTKYPNIKRVKTEFNTNALLIDIPGKKDGDKLYVRVHSFEEEYDEGLKNDFPHSSPSVFD